MARGAGSCCAQCHACLLPWVSLSLNPLQGMWPMGFLTTIPLSLVGSFSRSNPLHPQFALISTSACPRKQNCSCSACLFPRRGITVPFPPPVSRGPCQPLPSLAHSHTEPGRTVGWETLLHSSLSAEIIQPHCLAGVRASPAQPSSTGDLHHSGASDKEEPVQLAQPGLGEQDPEAVPTAGSLTSPWAEAQ